MASATLVGRGGHGSHPRRPSARAGALALDGAALAFVAAFVIAAVAFGQRGEELPTDNWWLFGPMLGAGVAALSGGVIALVAAARGDRHAILVAPLVLGGLAVLAIVGLPVLVVPVVVGGLAWFLVLVRRDGRGGRRC